MADDSTFGGQVGGATFGGGLNFGQGGSDASPDTSTPDITPSTPAPVAAPPQERASFGSMLPGPHYRQPDPAMSALDQTADVLQQRVKRANEVASNPLLQFFNPEGVQKARDFVPAAAEKLQQIKTQQAGIVAGKQQAATLGLAPGEVPDEATQADRIEAAKTRALKGDLRVFQGIQNVSPKDAEIIAPQVHEAAAGHLKNAQFAFDKLSNARNDGEYVNAVRQLQNEGTLKDLQALGLKVPQSLNDFNAAKSSEGQALRQARISLDAIGNKLAERNTYQPMPEAEAKTYKSSWKTVAGDAIETQPSRNAATNHRAGIVDGYDDPRKLGKGAVLATPEQRKSIEEDAKRQVEAKDLEKFRSNNRLYGMATTTREGKEIPAEGLPDGKGGKIYLNTNPNVQQGIAEGLASALRGGAGGATSGLLNIETSKRGYVQSVIDKAVGAYGGALNTLTGEQLKPYLTQATQQQMRDVLDYLQAYNKTDIPERLKDTAYRAGALGLGPGALGLGDKEAGAVMDDIERGRKDQIALDLQRVQAIGGGRGALIYGNLKPGAGVVNAPAGTGQVPQQPDQQASPQAASQPGGGTPSAGPSAPSPTGGPVPAGGGTPTPITVAGQTVNVTLPPGASPRYLQAMQRIESGNEKSPWTAGNSLSSAGGAFQAIKSTWAQNKPPGAPDDPRKATPQQQAEFAATLATNNAAALAAAKLPVNDTNLYIAHNLGAGGARALLSADPNADARSIVGEAAARNNKTFFRGKPTVAVALQRYADEMAQPGAPPTTKPDTSSLPDVGAAAWTGRTTPQGDRIATPEERAAGPVVEHAPAILSTAGAIGGSALGPAGAVGGGAVGGGAGQAFKDYMQGREQSPAKIAKQAALGGVLGVAPEGRPLLGAAARVAGVGGIEAGAEAAQGGSTADIVGAAAEGGAYALGGEALGRFISALGPAAHKVISNYTAPAQKELSAAAGKLVEARATLATEQPKLAGEIPNPKYEAAKKAEEEATQVIKDHNQKPDDMAYAYEQSKGGTSTGEAMVMRGAQSEKAAVSAGYDELRQQARDTGVGAVKANQPAPGGPVSQLRTAENPTGKVPEQFRPEAEHAEMLMKAPAKDWGEKWQQLQNAGSELIQKRLSFLANNDKPSADAMDALFKGVRNQQKAAAEYVFGPERGAKIISNLENLDMRYAKVMNATAGLNFERMRSILAAGNTPARRDLEKNFTEFAKGDPSAIRAFNAMKAGARGDWKSEAALMAPVIAAEVSGVVPTLGAATAAIGGYRLYKLVQGYMNARLLGKAVMFKDFLAQEIKSGFAQGAQTAAQRGAVMQ